MIGFCKESDADQFIIVTEVAMIHRLQREVPTKLLLQALRILVPVMIVAT